MAHILVIDDDEPICDLLEKMLEGSGHRVSSALNGDAALTVHRADPVDLVITDLIMPIKNGVETIKEIKKDAPHVKVIAITGKDPDYLKYAEYFGAEYCFEKPFQKKDMLEAIHSLVGDLPDN